MLQRHVAELEKANTQLEASNAEMQLTPSRSREAVTMLRRELDAELENYELLRVGNSRLLDEVRGQVADLESKLTETKVNADKDTAALEARLAAAETHAAEGSATVERRFEVAGDLAPLHESCERKIQSLAVSPARLLRPKTTTFDG
jgi:predicted RNase H-like nuclease (RuvC/YqgF family)